MAKQTYHIKAGSIAACVSILVGGYEISDAICIDAEKDSITFSGAVMLPEAVKDAVFNHFKEVYARGLRWLIDMYDTEYKHRIVASVQAPAAKNIVGSLVDVKFPDGWVSGYFVAGKTPATDKPYRVDVFGPSHKNKMLYMCDPACVRISPRAK